MKLNIANKLTLARIALVPFFAFFIIYPVFTYEHTTWVADHRRRHLHPCRHHRFSGR